MPGALLDLDLPICSDEFMATTLLDSLENGCQVDNIALDLLRLPSAGVLVVDAVQLFVHFCC